MDRTTPQQWPAAPKVLLPATGRQPTSTTTPLPTSASTDTAMCLTSSQETPTSWQTTPHACNTSQTPPSLLTSNRNIRSPNHGNCYDSHEKTLCSLRLVSPPQPQPQSAGMLPTRSLASGLTSAQEKANPAPSIPCFQKTSSATSWSLACDTAKEAKRVSLSDLAQFVMPSRPSPRGSPTWTAQIRNINPKTGNLHSVLTDFYRSIRKMSGMFHSESHVCVVWGNKTPSREVFFQFSFPDRKKTT
jgi:hypothetical protein